MERVICDIYFKGEKKLFGEDPTTPFNQKIEAVNNMYGWLYDSGILKNISFKYEDLNDSTYFAFDAENLKPYRKEMESCLFTGAELACRHIFDEKYSPCLYSGAIQLGLPMQTYRDNSGTVSRSWECDLVQTLNTVNADEIYHILKEKGPAEAVTAVFDKYDWDLMRDTIWISVYKDTLGYEDDYNNVTEICVPREWLTNFLNNAGIDLRTWKDEYTCDDTIDIADKAKAEGVILDCSDYNVKVHLDLALEPIYFVVQNYKAEYERNFICTEKEIEQVIESQAPDCILPYYEDNPESFYLAPGVMNAIFVCKSAEALSKGLQGFYNDMNYKTNTRIPWENCINECSKEALDIAKKYIIACEDIDIKADLLKAFNLISVERHKQSVTQATAKVLIDGHTICVYNDEMYIKSKDGKSYSNGWRTIPAEHVKSYSNYSGGWGSIKSDDAFMNSALKTFPEKVNDILTKSIGSQTLDAKIKAANQIIAEFKNSNDIKHNIERDDKEKYHG